MKNFKKIFFLLIIALMLSGCGKSSIEKSATRINNVIYKSLYEENPSLKKLNKKEREIYENFRQSQYEENYVVNLSELGLIYEESFASVPETSAIYRQNGDYLINYSDIEFTIVGEEQASIMAIDNYGITLFKKKVPILYDDTSNNPSYIYVFDYYKVFDDKIEYYYQNIVEGGGLVIRFKLENNNISKIYLLYEDEYVHEDFRIEENKKGPIRIMFIIIGTIMLLLAFIIIYKKIGNINT